MRVARATGRNGDARCVRAAGGAAQLGESAFFCPSETCRIAYFDAFERRLETDQLSRPAYPKDPAAPICGCFGVTCDEIEADVREGVATRTRALLDRAKSSKAHCSQMAASGQSCVAAVQRVFHEVPRRQVTWGKLPACLFLRSAVGHENLNPVERQLPSASDIIAVGDSEGWQAGSLPHGAGRAQLLGPPSFTARMLWKTQGPGPRRNRRK